MDSFPTHHNHRRQCNGKRPSSRRIPSFSSTTTSASSSSNSSTCSHDDYSLMGPATPLRLISRIPFSWEHFPGIPKNLNINNSNNNIRSSPAPHKLLPLPPPHHEDHQNRSSARKKNLIQGSFQRDPFFDALVECSKSNNNNNNNNNKHSDHHHHHEEEAKVSRSVSDRFEFVNLFTSCKRTCAVSESLVHLPSSSSSSRRTSTSSTSS